MAIDVDRKRILHRIVIGISFAILWVLSTVIGGYQTGLQNWNSNLISTFFSCMYIFGNFALIYYGYRISFVDVLLIIGAFWFLGAVGMLWALINDHTIPIFSWVSVLPVIIGFAYPSLGKVWNIVLTIFELILFFGIPIICVVLSVRLWKHVKRTEEK